MLKYSVIFTVCALTTVLSICTAQGLVLQNETQLPVPDKRSLDSSEVCRVGTWPSDVTWSVACDETRHLVFLGSADCVYILDGSSLAESISLCFTIHTRGCASALFYDDHTKHLFVGERREGVSIWNITKPDHPHEVGRFDTPGCACGLFIADSYAYVADGDDGFRILDISALSEPREIGAIMLPCACDVFVAGSYAFVVAEGLEIIDITSPAHPRKVAYWNSPAVIHDVCVSYPYVYVADDWGGLRIVDISQPTHPSEVGFYETPGYAWAVCVTNTYAYVAADHAGLRIIDVSKPSHPREVGYHETPNDALNVAVLGDHILVADLRYGLQVYSRY